MLSTIAAVEDVVTTKACVLRILIVTALLYCNNVESGFHQLSCQLPQATGTVSLTLYSAGANSHIL